MPDERPLHELIADEAFRRAVDLADDGDVDSLRRHLAAHPSVARRRVELDAPEYFRHPSLLEFVAENPIRHGRVPRNVVDVAVAILEAGARDDRAIVDGALALVASGRVVRECGVQRALIDMLCRDGASPDAALPAAVGHGEWDAVDALIARGARVTLPVFAALGRAAEVQSALAAASASERHLALAWSAQFGRADVVALLLDAGERPDRVNPPGAHAHSTPLHQAAAGGHAEVVRLLLERGARREVRDLVFDATPEEWAAHAGRQDVAALIRDWQ